MSVLTYNIAEFASGLNLEQFQRDLKASATITGTIDKVDLSRDIVIIRFVGKPGGTDDATISSIISAHDGLAATYGITTTFEAGVNTTLLAAEIAAAPDVAITVDAVTTPEADLCKIRFTETPSPLDMRMLDRIVKRHRAVIRGYQSYVPFVWKELNMLANSAASSVQISGFPPGIRRFAPVRNSSIVSVSVQLSAALTAGSVTFTLTIGGTPTAYEIMMTPTDGTSKKLFIDPGDLTGGPGSRIGFEWNSTATMAPSGSIDAVIYIETQTV